MGIEADRAWATFDRSWKGCCGEGRSLTDRQTGNHVCRVREGWAVCLRASWTCLSILPWDGCKLQKKETLHAFKPALPLVPWLYCHRSGPGLGQSSWCQWLMCACVVVVAGGQLQWSADSVTLVSLAVTEKDWAHQKEAKERKRQSTHTKYLSIIGTH